MLFRSTQLPSRLSQWLSSHSSPVSPRHHYLTASDLPSMGKTHISLKAKYFPDAFRCAHVVEKRACDEYCYIVEGRRGRSHRCLADGCQGGAFSDGGRRCFGRRGVRLALVGFEKESEVCGGLRGRV